MTFVKRLSTEASALIAVLFHSPLLGMLFFVAACGLLVGANLPVLSSPAAAPSSFTYKGGTAAFSVAIQCGGSPKRDRHRTVPGWHHHPDLACPCDRYHIERILAGAVHHADQFRS